MPKKISDLLLEMEDHVKKTKSSTDDVTDTGGDGSQTDKIHDQKVDAKKSSQEKSELKDEADEKDRDTNKRQVADIDRVEDSPIGEDLDLTEEEDEEKDDKKEEDDEEEMDESIEIDSSVDISEDVSSIFEGEKLNEAFQKKASTIIESLVKAKINEKVSSIKEQYTEKLNEAKASYKSQLNERVNDYLDYAISEWKEENAVAIEEGIRLQVADSFMKGLFGLFKEHYIEVPEGKSDLIEELSNEISELKEQTDKQVQANIEIKKQFNEALKVISFKELSEGLTETQKEKFEKLAEGVEATSAEEYNEKLEVIKEHYFTEGSTESDDLGSVDTDLITEDVDPWVNTVASRLK